MTFVVFFFLFYFFFAFFSLVDVQHICLFSFIYQCVCSSRFPCVDVWAHGFHWQKKNADFKFILNRLVTASLFHLVFQPFCLSFSLLRRFDRTYFFFAFISLFFALASHFSSGFFLFCCRSTTPKALHELWIVPIVLLDTSWCSHPIVSFILFYSKTSIILKHLRIVFHPSQFGCQFRTLSIQYIVWRWKKKHDNGLDAESMLRSVFFFSLFIWIVAFSSFSSFRSFNVFVPAQSTLSYSQWPTVRKTKSSSTSTPDIECLWRNDCNVRNQFIIVACSKWCKTQTETIQKDDGKREKIKSCNWILTVVSRAHKKKKRNDKFKCNTVG